MHIMLDIKTYSQQPNAAICQLGAMGFTFEGGGNVFYDRGFHRNIFMGDNIGHVDGGLSMSVATYTPKQVKEDRLANQVSIRQALQDLYAFPEVALDTTWDKIEGVWALDAAFDIAAIELAYHGIKQTPPWKKRAVHGLRTLFFMYGGFPKMESDNSIDLSNALSVAYLQAEMALVAHKKIKKAMTK